MARTWTLLAALLVWSAPPLRAMPACPSTWNWSFSDPAHDWPDTAKTSDAQTLFDMSRALYENCPRRKENDSLLKSAAEKFLKVTVNYSTHAANRQQSYFWLGMTYGTDAPKYDRQDNEARSALLNFISLTDESLRGQALEQVRALRVRSARQLASLSYHVHIDGQNLGEPGWMSSSQRVRCFLNTYRDTTDDEIVGSYLKQLNEKARDFIHDYESDSRYDLKGMRILTAELDKALTSPEAPKNDWPTKEDIDRADPRNPRNCYLRPSLIPDADKFDFDFSKKAVESRALEQKTKQRRAALKAASAASAELP